MSIARFADHDTATAIQPDSAGYFGNRGNCSLAKGDFFGALTDYGMANELDANSLRPTMD